MTLERVKTTCSIRRALFLIAAGILLNSPSVVFAETDDLVRATELVSAGAQRDVRRSLVLAMNRRGNVVMQYADLSVTMVRQPFDDDFVNDDLGEYWEQQLQETDSDSQPERLQ